MIIPYDIKYLLLVDISYINSIPLTGKDTVHNINTHVFIFAFPLRFKYGSSICII